MCLQQHGSHPTVLHSKLERLREMFANERFSVTEQTIDRAE
jgi:hypothetical protein